MILQDRDSLRRTSAARCIRCIQNRVEVGKRIFVHLNLRIQHQHPVFCAGIRRPFRKAFSVWIARADEVDKILLHGAAQRFVFRCVETGVFRDVSVEVDFFAAVPDAAFKSKEFSNARFVRNLYERTWGKAAYRHSLGGGELRLLKSDLTGAAADKEFENLLKKSEERRAIGF